MTKIGRFLALGLWMILKIPGLKVIKDWKILGVEVI